MAAHSSTVAEELVARSPDTDEEPTSKRLKAADSSELLSTNNNNNKDKDNKTFAEIIKPENLTMSDYKKLKQELHDRKIFLTVTTKFFFFLDLLCYNFTLYMFLEDSKNSCERRWIESYYRRTCKQ